MKRCLAIGFILTLFSVINCSILAEVEIVGDGILLYSPSVPEPVAVRYAFDDFLVGELYNTDGLPASSFRTDDWEIEKQ